MIFSEEALITIGAVFLFFIILSAVHKTFSHVMMLIGVILLGILVYQNYGGPSFIQIDVPAFKQSFINFSTTLGEWVSDFFLPRLVQVAEEIENYLSGV